MSDFQKTEEKILVTYIDISTDQSLEFANYFMTSRLILSTS